MSTEDPTKRSEQAPSAAIETSAEKPSLEKVEENAESNISSSTKDAVANTAAKVESVKTYSGAENADLQEAGKIHVETGEEINILNAEVTNQINAVLGNPENAQIATETKESKEKFPSGHILDPDLLDKIAQLESIMRDSGALESNQDVYQKYIQDEQRGKHGSYSVSVCQEVVKKGLDAGKSLSRIVPRLDVIYGEGGFNRYSVDSETGMVKLASLGNATNTTGSPEYFAVLRAKAQELGLDL